MSTTEKSPISKHQRLTVVKYLPCVLLMRRLERQYGLRGVMLQWFRSYLCGQTFQVVYGVSTSSTMGMFRTTRLSARSASVYTGAIKTFCNLAIKKLTYCITYTVIFQHILLQHQCIFTTFLLSCLCPENVNFLF